MFIQFLKHLFCSLISQIKNDLLSETVFPSVETNAGPVTGRDILSDISNTATATVFCCPTALLQSLWYARYGIALPLVLSSND